MRSSMRMIMATGLALSAGLAFAQTLYKWVDANGVVHYSEQPPAKGKSSKFDVHAGTSVPVADVKPAAASSSGFAADDKAYRSAACDSARRDLAVLGGKGMIVSGGTLSQPAEVEQATKLTPAQRDAARAAASKRVHDFCGQG
ncbi:MULTISPECIES: DUF4124 domain-containing protein [Dyella]|nr:MULTISPECIES: DUF4124 domain-containing protein [Dyella]